MYSLILTADERKAIDWIGKRYSHGHDLLKLLLKTQWYKVVKHGPPFGVNELDNILPGHHVVDENVEDVEWGGGDYDILFMIQESIAWVIAELINQSSLECFSESLQCKLRSFAERVV